MENLNELLAKSAQEWTEDDIVELDQGDFINYVMDNWSWSNEFITTNSFYASKVGKGV